MSTAGMQHTGVLGDLYARPYAYDFFQAVRLLRAAQMQQGAVGDDPVRFRTLLSLETPASAIYTLTQPDAFRPPVMTITFMGLTGPSGALPVRYTEMLLERRYRHRDQTAHNFFDLFSHRLTTLFYQAWQKHHIFVDYERGGREGFQRQVLSLVGLGTPGLQRRLSDDGVDDQLFAYYAGRFAERAHTVEGLQSILSDQFDVKVVIEQFRGQWLRLDDNDCTQLGQLNCTLGEHPMLGKQIWDCQTKFRICVGPLKRRRFDDFLPTGKAYRALVRMVKFCVGQALEFDVQLVLDKRETPPCILGELGRNSARLGWTTWLDRPKTAINDASDVVLPEHAQRLAAAA
ncbi:type VI secretion system protein ImpH [Andreprevotia lacus DSM 23236]|jgi:type VI secretion system protein ImpH|uniref:Type VI secretion system protein ImpH n=1 Tax=Andreprevotia lacus DSM 23236 TaxID=1121001 RepID=A0A1W1XFY2_9NEIS|nr:type VI secretion system baseplate subunit TssG [Andreprevotia lacus]SMC22850.1 type VI secretion system protein ImpH [Andreprevotia lacus DSM 23236]